MGQNHREALETAWWLSLAQQIEQGCVTSAFEFPQLLAIRSVISVTVNVRDKVVFTAYDRLRSVLK